MSKFALARFTALAVATLLLGFVCFAQETASSAGFTAIRAGRLVDVDAGRVPTNQVIVVRDGKIESIAGNASIPASAAVIDLSNSAADLLGKSDLLGSMQPGKSADIIPVNGDPPADIHAIEHVELREEARNGL